MPAWPSHPASGWLIVSQCRLLLKPQAWPGCPLHSLQGSPSTHPECGLGSRILRKLQGAAAVASSILGAVHGIGSHTTIMDQQAVVRDIGWTSDPFGTCAGPRHTVHWDPRALSPLPGFPALPVPGSKNLGTESHKSKRWGLCACSHEPS